MGEVGPGTHGLFFLKKGPKEVKLTKKRKCRICRKGTEGANSEAWNVQFGPRSSPLLCSPGLEGLEEKQMRRKQLWKESR